MKRKFHLLTLAAALLAGCTADLAESVPPVAADEPATVSGVLCVKLDRETADALSVTHTRSGAVSTGNLSFDELCERYEIVSMKRLFVDERYEQRMRSAGLDLWYRVVLGNTRAADRVSVVAELEAAEGVTDVVPVNRVHRLDNGEARYATREELEAMASTRAAAQPFDDEYLGSQWMLHNDGTVYSGAVAGADIDVYDAWKLCAGNPSVIVAVMDGGVDYRHPDLADNIWEGIGCNFFSDDEGRGEIVADEHGTHVAGTIAAVSNNGIGIAGIAGGDGTPGSGVKIMSCQIFPDDDSFYDYETGDDQVAQSIVFAANNGAVISQNSWGYEFSAVYNDFYYNKTAKVIKDAFDYFIRFAGTTPDSTPDNLVQDPDSPMLGGVVLFAAGNAGRKHTEYPASYGDYLSVAAMSCNMQATYYTNYNEKVDILAPGGGGWTDTIDGRMKRSGFAGYNISTLPTTLKNGDRDSFGDRVDYVETTGYGWMTGTSMATPHATGVAALVVSHLGGPGFTAERLKDILVETARDVDSYQREGYAGFVGGLVDAAAALNAEATVDVELNVDLYPNPCTDRLHMKSNVTCKAHVTVCDRMGFRIKSVDVDFEKNTPRTWTVDDLDSGVYSFTFEVEGADGTMQRLTRTVIKK